MKNKVILIQGALEIEIDYLVSQLKNKEVKNIAGYEFFEGYINDIKVVISKTDIGTINSTTSTTIGITTFKPDIVINQGIAGSHRKDIHTGDIVIGEKCCNINSYKMPKKDEGEGSNPFEWELNKRAKNVQYADSTLVNLFENTFKAANKEKVYKGTLGSGDVFNKEFDRILWINNILRK